MTPPELFAFMSQPLPFTSSGCSGYGFGRVGSGPLDCDHPEGESLWNGALALPQPTAPTQSKSLRSLCGWGKAGCSIETSVQTPEKHC